MLLHVFRANKLTLDLICFPPKVSIWMQTGVVQQDGGRILFHFAFLSCWLAASFLLATWAYMTARHENQVQYSWPLVADTHAALCSMQRKTAVVQRKPLEIMSCSVQWCHCHFLSETTFRLKTAFCVLPIMLWSHNHCFIVMRRSCVNRKCISEKWTPVIWEALMLLISVIVC